MKTITLANLHLATKQEVFDQVATHLMVQGEKSIDYAHIVCKYRHNGLKCAAGCLIADDEYSDSMDMGDNTWEHLIRRELVKSAEHFQLISKLQSIHDNIVVPQWPVHLDVVASLHNLKLPKIVLEKLA